MLNRYPDPSAAARALFEALQPKQMRRLKVCDVPGGIAVISAAFDVIVDVGAAKIPTLPRVIDHMRATSRDLMLVNLELENHKGMVALCRFTEPYALASSIVGVSELSFHLDAVDQLALVHASEPDYARLNLQSPRIKVAGAAPQTARWHQDGIARAGLVIRAARGSTGQPETIHWSTALASRSRHR